MPVDIELREAVLKHADIVEVIKSYIDIYHLDEHAEEIVKVFDSLYPKYNGEFARVIDNQVNFASTVIESFEVPEKFPQIAVSVDMLDTGIDVPEVLKQMDEGLRFIGR